MVSWQPPQTPNGIIRGYQVNYFASGGPIETIETTSTSTLLTGLSSHTTYTIFVRARTVVLGSSSTLVMTNTKEDGKHSILHNCLCNKEPGIARAAWKMILLSIDYQKADKIIFILYLRHAICHIGHFLLYFLCSSTQWLYLYLVFHTNARLLLHSGRLIMNGLIASHNCAQIMIAIDSGNIPPPVFIRDSTFI